VVFVWFRDTSTLLQQNLEGFNDIQGTVEEKSGVAMCYCLNNGEVRYLIIYSGLSEVMQNRTISKNFVMYNSIIV
jgi:hypothetical protein